MIPEYRLTAENVRRQTMETLTEHLSLQANGYRCTTDPGIDDRIGHVELDTGKVYRHGVATHTVNTVNAQGAG